jgi:hypothetical protein
MSKRGAAPKTKDQPHALAHAPGTPIIAVFKDALAISERLALSDPSNTIWQHDLAVRYPNIASVSVHPGDAVAAPRKARAIITRLIAIDPNNEQWRKNLSWFDNQIANAKGRVREQSKTSVKQGRI